MHFTRETAPTAHRKASSEVLRRLAHNVNDLRRARGYTQQELADLCHLTKTYVSKVECAAVNITLANLQALAEGLGSTAADLLRKRLDLSRAELDCSDRTWRDVPIGRGKRHD